MRMEEYMQYFQLKNYHRKPGSANLLLKKALKELDDAGLLIRKFGGFSKPRHMYVMIQTSRGFWKGTITDRYKESR